MHIAYIYPEITIKGGADRVIVEKANYLAEHGWKVTIVTESQMGRGLTFPLHPSVGHVDMGLDFYQQYRENFWKRGLTYLSLMRRYKQRLYDFLHRERPDVVITVMGRSIDIVGKMHDGSVKIGEAHSVKRNVRSLNQLESRGGFYALAACYMRWKISRNVSRLDALVLLTEEDAAEWTEARCRVVIPNAIPFLPAAASSLNNKKAIMVARYNDAKGYNYMVDAWTKVHERHPDWKLHVYGSGELHDEVVRWIQEHHLSETMILHEPVDNIMECYLDSSMCVMSSRYEAFPMVLLEAMACGVPCVAFDCPNGPRNIIHDGEDGILVEYLNVQALADGICRLIENEALRKRLGATAKENIGRFSKEKVMLQWEELLNSYRV